VAAYLPGLLFQLDALGEVFKIVTNGNICTSLATFGDSFPPARIDGGLLYLVQHLHGRLISLTAAVSFNTKSFVKK